jgi:hypothetical protein
MGNDNTASGDSGDKTNDNKVNCYGDDTANNKVSGDSDRLMKTQ